MCKVCSLTNTEQNFRSLKFKWKCSRKSNYCHCIYYSQKNICICVCVCVCVPANVKQHFISFYCTFRKKGRFCWLFACMHNEVHKQTWFMQSMFMLNTHAMAWNYSKFFFIIYSFCKRLFSFPLYLAPWLYIITKRQCIAVSKKKILWYIND